MRKFCSILTFAFLAPLLQAAPATEEVIAKARAYLGGDSALDQIKSISYEGDFTTAAGGSGTIKIIFQKPLQQRMEILHGEIGEVTALNDFDAWRKKFDANDERKWSLELLNATSIREIQASTWENLNFFHGIESRRGWIENEGSFEVDGHQAVKLIFHHPRGLRFTRFFDTETGRLLKTQTHDGLEIRETGEIRVKGVVFPEKLTMSRDGEVLNEIRFHEVKLNEQFEDSLFDVPSFAPVSGGKAPTLPAAESPQDS